VKLSTRLRLVPRPRMVEPLLDSPIRLNGIVLTGLSLLPPVGPNRAPSPFGLFEQNPYIRGH
jgi:hypothetical protein